MAGKPKQMSQVKQILRMHKQGKGIKSGLQHLTKYMAKFFKGKNIRVNSIALGGLEDGQPEDFLKAYKKQCLNKGILMPKMFLEL